MVGRGMNAPLDELDAADDTLAIDPLAVDALDTAMLEISDPLDVLCVEPLDVRDDALEAMIDESDAPEAEDCALDTADDARLLNVLPEALTVSPLPLATEPVADGTTVPLAAMTAPMLVCSTRSDASTTYTIARFPRVIHAARRFSAAVRR